MEENQKEDRQTVCAGCGEPTNTWVLTADGPKHPQEVTMLERYALKFFSLAPKRLFSRRRQGGTSLPEETQVSKTLRDIEETYQSFSQ